MIKKGVAFAIVLLFSAFLVVNFVFADQSTQSLLARELGCRINFNIGVLNSVGNYSNSSEIQQSVTTLQNDLSQAQSFNNSEVRNFEMGQYSNDMKSIISSVKSFRQGRDVSFPNRNVSARTNQTAPVNSNGMYSNRSAALASFYNQLQQVYLQCEQQVYYTIGQQRLQQYQTQMAKFQNETNNLQNRGFDVTSLTQLLDNAQTEIIQPLQSALLSANNSQSVMTAVQTYCLYDGCVNGANFHMDANFDVARLNIILNYLQANKSSLNLDNATLSQAQQDLSNAQSTLNSVGASIYKNGQSQLIFGDIQDASKIIVQLVTQVIKESAVKLK
ncbi:MAG: hypothetical protein WAU65_02530 [Candidatus Nanoarchaeia archaeon]